MKIKVMTKENWKEKKKKMYFIRLELENMEYKDTFVCLQTITLPLFYKFCFDSIFYLFCCQIAL